MIKKKYFVPVVDVMALNTRELMKMESESLPSGAGAAPARPMILQSDTTQVF